MSDVQEVPRLVSLLAVGPVSKGLLTDISLGRIEGTEHELRGCCRRPTCGSALGFLAAAATWLSVAGRVLRGLSLSCPWNFVQLVSIVGNLWVQHLNPVFVSRDGAARSVVTGEAGIPTSLFATAAQPSLS